MALHTRPAVFGLATGIDTTQIARTSRMVSNYTGMPVQPNKAIVGANAFAHEAGIHQDGMLKNQLTYEIMRPDTVGMGSTQLVLGKHSGRHALKSRLVELGYTLGDADLDRAFTEFKRLADKKKVIADADLEALISEEMAQAHELFVLDGMQVACGTMNADRDRPPRMPDGQTGVGRDRYRAVDANRAIDSIISTRHAFRAQRAHTEGISARPSPCGSPAPTMLQTMDAQRERRCGRSGLRRRHRHHRRGGQGHLSALNKLCTTLGAVAAP
jgi:2-isopropylmalate synthase